MANTILAVMQKNQLDTGKIMQRAMPDGVPSTPSPVPQNHTLGLGFILS
jgi:hypothetical protein